MIWRLPEKLFCFFLFGEHLRLYPWPRAILSLVSRGFVLERAVLGLERVCPRKSCPWTRIFFVFLALSLVFSTPPSFATNVVWKLSQCEILIPSCRLSKKTKKKLLHHNYDHRMHTRCSMLTRVNAKN